MIIIVGAGPAGLATAYYLQQAGLPYQILEKQTVGNSWENHYERLHLHTLKPMSMLPGLPMPQEYPRFVSRKQLAAYLHQYAAYFNLNIETGITVQHADFADGWLLQTNRGPVSAEVLVVATGIWSTPYRPTFAGEADFAGQISHAQSYYNPEPFLGHRVLVVGGGNTGTEIAVDLQEAGIETAILMRGGSRFVPYPFSSTLMHLASLLMRKAPPPIAEKLLRSVSHDYNYLGISFPPGMLIDAYPVVGFELPEAVESGKIKLYNHAIDRFTEHGVLFTDGEHLAVDAVILATGYRPTVDFVQHELEFDQRGWPILQSGHRSTKNPHLYCIGFQYPAIEGWLQSIGRKSKAMVQNLQQQYEKLAR